MMLVDETKLQCGTIEMIGAQMGVSEWLGSLDGEDYYEAVGEIVRKLQAPKQMSISKGQDMVKMWLQCHNIPYKQEYPVKINGHNRRFDFAIYNDNGVVCFIEYDGEQHYKIVKSWGGEEGLQNRQKVDREKDAWAEKQGKFVIRVPYWVESYQLDEFFANPSGVKRVEPWSSGIDTRGEVYPG